MNARETLLPTADPTVLAREIGDAADDIECAIETVNGLLRLALDQLAGVTNTQADAAIRGAKRFIDDIGGIAQQLHSSAGLRSTDVKMAATPAAPSLPADEQRWLEAYRVMDDEGRHKNLIAMESQASRFPRWVSPRLRQDGGGVA